MSHFDLPWPGFPGEELFLPELGVVEVLPLLLLCLYATHQPTGGAILTPLLSGRVIEAQGRLPGGVCRQI